MKLTEAFTDCKAAKNTVFGNADCILCDAAKVFDVTRHVLAPEPGVPGDAGADCKGTVGG